MSGHDKPHTLDLIPSALDYAHLHWLPLSDFLHQYHLPASSGLKGESVMFKRGLYLERTFPHTMEHVWRALTDPALLAKWLMKNDFRPEIGHRFTFQTTASAGFNGIIMCEVTEVDALHLLAYTWTGGILSKATTVRWMLEPAEDGTRLTLEHSGFIGVTGMLASGLMGSGWRKMMGERLPLVLDGKEIPKQPVMLMKNE